MAHYRLIGYENRVLNAEDFNDDTKDAGEIGAGHTVTALYEIIPKDQAGGPAVDELKYQKRKAPVTAGTSNDLCTVKLRYKLPQGKTSRLLTVPVTDDGRAFDTASPDFHHAAVAAFGMLLRDSRFKGSASYGMVEERAETGLRNDRYGYRRSFLELVALAKAR